MARLGEGHADALAILHEAMHQPPMESRLGVWAAGPLDGVRATPVDGTWRLDGVRRWCSGAFVLSHALVTAAAPDGPRLFLVPIAASGVLPDASTWPAVGMAGSGTYDVAFEDVVVGADAAVGCPGFYLARPGFWVGAAGVAAVWLGGAEGVAETLTAHAAGDPHALAHLGAVSARLATLTLLLGETGREMDRVLAGAPGSDVRPLLELLARSLRAEVEAGATEILERTGRATGAGPLGHDGAHARRVADLTVYLRQSHAERDLEVLGGLALRQGPVGWTVGQA